ncbi:MAG: FAD-dependent oxidoreductase [Candidatus Omnitrophica bacterium]|nr:FAD-dependent oxidoreductase [Candidatus Omnitrophota bacterium]
MDEVQVTIIGAGVVGLAVARALAAARCEAVVLERHGSFGQETSSRNSEVVHAGIYYPPGSRKARFCVQGARMLYEYCARRAIACVPVGKLIVACGRELNDLYETFETAKANGAQHMRLLEKKEISTLEPSLHGDAAIFSPRTGIVDSHSLMKAFFAEAKENGVLFSFGTEVNRIEKTSRGFLIGFADDSYCFRSRVVVNSGGLFAEQNSRVAGIDTAAYGYDLRYSKGSYFSYSGVSPVSRLVYPVPSRDLEGLGIHATVNLAGALRFGPDTEEVKEIDYDVSCRKRELFYDRSRKMIRGLDIEKFHPDTAGIRPKRKGKGFQDFVIQEESAKQLDGLITLLGIESPGLTASLAIGERVRHMVQKMLN